MASIRRYAGGWRADVQKRGVRKTKTFESKREAQEWASEIETEIIAMRSGKIPNKTVGDLLQRYLEEVSVEKRGWKWERDRINLLKRDQVAAVKLEDLKAPDMAGWRDRRLKRVSAASVRREWNLLNHAFNIAVREWHWLRDNPLKHLRRPAPPPPRDKLITSDEIKALTDASGYPGDTLSARVGAAFLLALETGLRAGEIARIRPDHVRGRVLHVPTSKSGTARDVPLSSRAVEILDDVGNNLGLSATQISTLFTKIRKKAGIDGITFHDSRHYAITHLAKKLDVLELARMVGHRDLKMLLVYYNERPEAIAKKLD